MNTINPSPLKTMFRIVLWPFRSYLRILLIVGVIGLYIYQAIKVDMLAKEIRVLEIKRAQLLHENTNLKTELDQLTNINRIEKIARDRFNLINAGKEIEYLVIEPYEPETSLKAEQVNYAGVK